MTLVERIELERRVADRAAGSIVAQERLSTITEAEVAARTADLSRVLSLLEEEQRDPGAPTRTHAPGTRPLHHPPHIDSESLDLSQVEAESVILGLTGERRAELRAMIDWLCRRRDDANGRIQQD